MSHVHVHKLSSVSEGRGDDLEKLRKLAYKVVGGRRERATTEE